MITASATVAFGVYVSMGSRDNIGSGSGARNENYGMVIACDTDSPPIRQHSHNYYNVQDWSGASLDENTTYHMENIFDGNDTNIFNLYDAAYALVRTNSEAVAPTYGIINFQPIGGASAATHICTYDAVNDRINFDYRSGDGGQVTGWFDTLRIRKYISPEPAHGAWGSEEAVVWPF